MRKERRRFQCFRSQKILGGGIPYKGSNPLIPTKEGLTIPKHTLLTQDLAIAGYEPFGVYAWRKKASADGAFIGFVTSNDPNEYPDGDIHTDGFYYKRLSSSELPIQYTYTGSSRLETGYDESAGDLIWQLELLTSGTLNISEINTPIIDAFLVGAGGGGAGGCAGIAGGGGGGGYVKTELDASIAKNVDHNVVIGAGGVGGTGGNGTDATTNRNNAKGGTGGSTSAFGFTAAGGDGGTHESWGKGGDGGSGGGSAYTSTMHPGTGSGTTTKAFGTGPEYAGGGGGGLSTDNSSTSTYYGIGGDGGSNGSNGNKGKSSFSQSTGGNGGLGGGGNRSKNGDANSGGGGGGGSNSRSSSRRDTAGNGGSGGSGIVILRGRYS